MTQLKFDVYYLKLTTNFILHHWKKAKSPDLILFSAMLFEECTSAGIK
jgi:hypothetical protein